MQIHNAVITGSFSYNGADLSNVTSSNAYSASLSSRTTNLETTSSVLVGASASFSSILTSVSSSQQQISASLLNVIAVYATTGSNSFRADQSVTGSLTVTGQIVAQTLNVQQVTSSIVFSSGSNTFGCDLNSRQTFTGSVNITGSLTVNTTGTELQVNNNGVILGNLLADNHSITGSLRITGSQIIFGNAGIGTSPSVTNGTTELAIGSSNTNPLINGIRDGVSAFSLSSDSAGTVLNERRNLDLRFNSNNIERMRITSTGVMEMNACDATYIRFSYLGTSKGFIGVAGALTDIISGAAAGDLTIRAQQKMQFSTGGDTPRMTITCGGNVGIGTSTPDVTGFGWNTLTIKGGNTAGNAGVIELQNTVTVSDDQNLGIITFLDGTSRNAQISVRRQTSTSTAHMDFFTNAGAGIVERMRITSGGNVGIGTTTTCGLLSLKAEVTNTPTIVFQNSSGGPNSAISNYTSAAQTFTVIGTNVYVNSAASLARFNTSFASSGISFDEGDIAFSTGCSSMTPTQRMRILSGGDVNIVGSNVRSLGGSYVLRDSANTLTGGLFGPKRNWFGCGTDWGPIIAAETGYGIHTYTNGNVSPSGPYVAPGGTTWTNGSSDARKKKNFETTQGLAEILQVEPIKYHFNEDDNDSKKRLGFKAQNILPLIPEMVSETGELAEDGSPYLTVTPDYILPVLVKAIQELKAENDIFKSCLGIY